MKGEREASAPLSFCGFLRFLRNIRDVAKQHEACIWVVVIDAGRDSILTPAAILLIAFTHYPTIATVFDSLFSKGTAIRPSRFVGSKERLSGHLVSWV